jgi:hypothetical protein
MDAQRLAKDKNPINRVGGAFAGKVGFKLEDGGEQSSPD